jgi:hypothetical protein
MNNAHFHFPSYTNQDFRGSSTSDTIDPGDATSHSQTGESTSPGRSVETGTTALPGLRVSVAKRSLNAAFGDLPPQGPAAKRSRTGTDNLARSCADNTATFSAPVFIPHASIPIVSKAPETSFPASNVRADVLSMLDLLENALSQDDEIATRHTYKFLDFQFKAGTELASFIEGLKILVMHAARRRGRPLPGMTADDIFRKGVSRLKIECIATVHSKSSPEIIKLMLSQTKKLLFAPGTPREFIDLAEAQRLDKPVNENCAEKSHTCHYALKALGVFTVIKSAFKRKNSTDGELSCQKRIEAMRLQIPKKDTAESGFSPYPDTASSAPAAISARSNLIAKLEARQKVTEDEVGRALSEYIESLDEVRHWIRLAHACSRHLSMPSNQVDGFDAVALVRLASVRLLNQQQRWRSVRGKEEARMFGMEVERCRLDASTPVEHFFAAQAAADLKAHPRAIDLIYAETTIRAGMYLFAPTAAVDAILVSPTWQENFGTKPYEKLLAECVLPKGADVTAPDSKAIATDGIASALASPGNTENTTVTTPAATTITTTMATADSIAAIATSPLVAPVAQAEAAIWFTPPAGQAAANGFHAARQESAPVARDTRFSIEKMVNKRF